MTKRGAVRLLPAQDLDLLNPQRLTSYRRRLLQLEESHELSDVEPDDARVPDAEHLLYKSDVRWRAAYDDVQSRIRLWDQR